MLQYSTNSDFSPNTVQGKYPFSDPLPGSFITVSWAAERVSCTLSLSPGWLEQSWVSLASPGPEKPEITHRHLKPPGRCLGTPGDA